MRQVPIACEQRQAEAVAAKTYQVIDYRQYLAAGEEIYQDELRETSLEQARGEGNAGFDVLPVVIAEHIMCAVKEKQNI